MKRSSLIITALAAFLSWVMPSHAQTFTMKLSSPTVNDVTHEWMKAFKAGVEQRSRDRIKVEIYPAGQLGQIPATVEGVAMGTIEVTAPATGFLTGLEPRFQVFDTPGLFDDMPHAQRVLADPEMRKRLATFGSAKGVEPIAAWAHGPLLLLSHKPVRTAADFKGQKIRVPGAAPLHIEPFKKLGALPVSMPLGEVAAAMQNRTIDGLIAAASVFTAFKYYDIAKPLTVMPGSFLVVAAVTSKDFLKSLGKELETAVREEAFAAQRAVEKFAVDDVARSAEVWQRNGGENITLAAAEGQTYLATVKGVIPNVVGANPRLKEEYESWVTAGARLRK